MTTDPNDVDAWLDQFAPEVDRSAPRSTHDGTVPVEPPGFPRSAPAGYPSPDPVAPSLPQSTFSAPAAVAGFPDPAAYTPSPPQPVPATPTPPRVEPPVVPRLSAPAVPAGAADGLTASQVGSTIGTTWNEEPWSDEKFNEATGGIPAVNSAADFSQNLESPLPKAEPNSRSLGFLLEWLPILVGAAIVAALVRTFVFQAFYIPSSSMLPTLKEQDRVLVNKLSYDFNDVGWGDVIVFKRPPDAPGPVPDLIKRVMALPGDTIEVYNGDVYVNNVRAEESYLFQAGASVGLRRDNIPGCEDATPTRCTVPEGYVFVMGDNRAGSTDSRSFGPIPIEDIVGRAVVRVWPLDSLAVF